MKEIRECTERFGDREITWWEYDDEPHMFMSREDAEFWARSDEEERMVTVAAKFSYVVLAQYYVVGVFRTLIEAAQCMVEYAEVHGMLIPRATVKASTAFVVREVGRWGSAQLTDEEDRSVWLLRSLR